MMIGFAGSRGKCGFARMGVRWVSFSATVGGIRGNGDTEIEMEFGEIGDVAVVVWGVGSGTGEGDRGAAGRLGVLPDEDVRGSAGGDNGWVQGAAVGGWTGVLIDEKCDWVKVLGGDMGAN